MNTNRRSFLKRNVLLSSSILLAGPVDALAKASRTIYTKSVNQKQINIMYSNDINGAVNSTSQGFGGLKSLQTTINNELVSTLLLDAGGFLNFNQNNHTETIQRMNSVGYYAVNLSAADLKQGADAFANLLPYMAFDLLSCNYHFEDRRMQLAVKPYQILKYGKFKVGVTGVGETAKVAGVTVSDPVKSLNKVAAFLKEEAQCDLVVCLSHLGFDLEAKENNHKLAALSNKVDLVVGGNAQVGRSLLRVISNSKKEEVLLGQNYSGAQSVSLVTLEFNGLKQKTLLDLKQRVPGADQSLHVSESLSLIKQNQSKYNT